MYVNLVIGSRRWCRTISPNGMTVTYMSENGNAVGMGSVPDCGEEDADLINAASRRLLSWPRPPISTARSPFGMIRGR